MSEPTSSACPPPGRFSWNELITTDPTASSAFYGALFGWKATPFVPEGAPAGGPPYLLLKTEAAEDMGVGGMMQAPAPGVPTHWLPYVVVTDAAASLARAAELGATTLVPVMAIGGVGRIAVLRDPLGAVIGLHEPPK